MVKKIQIIRALNIKERKKEKRKKEREVGRKGGRKYITKSLLSTVLDKKHTVKKLNHF